MGLCVLLLLGGCGGDDAHEDYGSLSAALSSARAGDTVRVGAVRISGGTLVVPPGVTLQGAGDGATVVVAPTDSVGIYLQTADGVADTRLTGLSVESGGTAAVLARGTGSAAVDRCTITASLGIAVGAEGVARFTVTDVTATGPVTPAIADMLPPDVSAASTATHGLVLVNVADARLTRVWMNGFALFGALSIASGVTWSEGGADGNLGTALMAYGGTATLDSVQACGSLQGQSLIPAYGAVFAAGAVVDTTGFTACDGEGYGMLQHMAAARHSNLVATGNENAAVWVQFSESFSLAGSSSRIADNAFAGVVGVEATNLSLSDATISDTRLARRLAVGSSGTVDVGDGIQLNRSTTGVTLTAVTFDQNPRCGFVADLDGGDTTGITLDGVTVSGADTALGVVVQNGMAGPGWDSGVSRSGGLATRDAAFVSAGSILEGLGEVVAPTDLPTPVGADGLESLGVVAPTD